MTNESVLRQCLLGLECGDFVMMAADQMDVQGVLVFGGDVDKLFEVSDKQVLGVAGESAEVAQFTQFVNKNLALYKIRNKYQLDTAAVAHFTRKSIADRLRSETPYNMNMLIGGFDEQFGAQLYTLDSLGTCVRVPNAVHGLGGLLSYSILDHYYKPNLSVPEAYKVLKLCIRVVQRRLIINLPNFGVKTISKHGIQTLPSITSAMFLHE